MLWGGVVRAGDELQEGVKTGPRCHLEWENMGVGMSASCHGAYSRDFSVEMGSGTETQMVPRKGRVHSVGKSRGCDPMWGRGKSTGLRVLGSRELWSLIISLLIYKMSSNVL